MIRARVPPACLWLMYCTVALGCYLSLRALRDGNCCLENVILVSGRRWLLRDRARVLLGAAVAAKCVRDGVQQGVDPVETGRDGRVAPYRILTFYCCRWRMQLFPPPTLAWSMGSGNAWQKRRFGNCKELQCSLQPAKDAKTPPSAVGCFFGPHLLSLPQRTCPCTRPLYRTNPECTSARQHAVENRWVSVPSAPHHSTTSSSSSQPERSQFRLLPACLPTSFPRLGHA